MAEYDGLKITNADTEEVKKGKWVEYAGGVDIRIAPYENLSFLRKLTKEIAKDKPYQDAYRDAMAGTILTEWRNFFVHDEEEGKDVLIEYTEKRCETVLKNDEMLLNFVSDYCRERNNYVKRGFVSLKKKS